MASPETSSRYERLFAEFDRLESLPDHDRDAALALLSRSDPAFARELSRLIENSAPTARDRFGDAVRDLAGVLTQPDDDLAGRRIADYVLVRELGRGGMGTVWLAERRAATYTQQVALKLLQQRALSGSTLERFFSERQILARLNHPNIATLIDAGAAADGTPYLAMEYVDGEPIAAWCDRRALRLADRLRLFESVLSAVQYAHRHLVVHRDLKPGNILVGADGTPKLLDFGIAKLLGEGDATTTSTRLFTPAYASPEQRAGRPVTTASDIYSLGLVLHELASGVQREVDERRGASELLRAAAPAAREAIAAKRATTPRRLARALAGDVDRILEKALAHDPAQRYAAAQSFADDLKCLREGRALQHAPGGLGYRFVKTVARHRVGAAVAATALSGLAAVGVSSWIAADRLRVERDAAIAAQASAQRVTEYLIDVFRAADPNRAQGKAVTARELLDTGSAKIDALAATDPRAQAMLLGALASIYHHIGAADRSVDLHRRSIAQWERVGTADPLPLVAELNATAGTLFVTNAFDEAEAAIARAMALLDAAGIGDHPARARLLNTRGALEMNRGAFGSAKPWLDRAIAMYRSVGVVDTPEYATALQNVASIASDEARYEDARRALDEVLALRTRLLGEGHSDTLFTMSSVGRVQRELGQHDAALATLERALALRIRAFGAAHPEAGALANEIANVYHDRGDYEGAKRHYEQSIAIERAAGRGGTMDIALPINNYASLEEEFGDYASAERMFRESLEIRRRHGGDDTNRVARAEHNLARVLWRLGRYDEAEALWKAAHAKRVALYGREHLEPMLTEIALATLAFERDGDLAAVDRAVALSHKAIAQAKDTPTMRGQIEGRLGSLLADAGRWPEAEAALRAALASLAAMASPDSPLYGGIAVKHGIVLAALGRAGEADALIAQWRGIVERRFPANARIRKDLAAYDAARAAR